MTPRRKSAASLAVAILALAACDIGLGPTLRPGPTDPPGRPTPGALGPSAQGPLTPSSLGRAILYHVQFATGIDPSGAPIELSDSFAAGTEEILALVAWEFVDPRTELRLRLFEGDQLVLDESHVVVNDEALGEGAAGWVVPMRATGGFDAGTYTAELAYNGVPDELATFTVGDAPAPGVIQGSGVATGPIPFQDPSEVLVITRESVLRAKLGSNADAVLEAAGAVGDLHDLGTAAATPDSARTEVQRLLRAGRFAYLLILGNDDAVPYFHLDNPKESSEKAELDGWQLPADWMPSDDPYADLDGDAYGVPDLAVARIPSSEDADLLLTQLGAAAPPDGGGYALVNQERRSQAGAVISTIGRQVGVGVDYAPPAGAARFAGSTAAARYTYVLLHGIGVETDSWVANLEDWTPADPDHPYDAEWTVAENHYFDGVAIGADPGSRGIVQVGACYGAWTLDTVQEPVHKTADNNLALRFLKSGSRAFIADTHISYSYPLGPGDPAIGRTGFEVALWRAIGEGMAPIDAFQLAKVEVASVIDELIATNHPSQAATNLKTLHEMVYLGRP